MPGISYIFSASETFVVNLPRLLFSFLAVSFSDDFVCGIFMAFENYS